MLNRRWILAVLAIGTLGGGAAGAVEPPELVYAAAVEALRKQDCASAVRLFREYLELDKEYLKKHADIRSKVEAQIGLCTHKTRRKREGKD